MEQMEITRELRSFLDAEGRLKALPVKQRKRMLALVYLYDRLEAERTYTESEINGLLNGWTCFRDPATVRRELYNHHFLNRTTDGTSYWKEPTPPTL